MEQFGAFYAKTHFSELLAEVAKGKKFLISKHGHTIAMLIPFSQDVAGEETGVVVGAIRAIKNLRSGTKLGKDLSIKQMKSEGRA
jgi:antitoxin (DNA-binding transcriptional repressor) of toxin-antitoxin stability system